MEALRILNRLHGSAPVCPVCGALSQDVAFFNAGELRREALSAAFLATPLAEAGFCESDIVRMEKDDGAVCIELKGGLS